MMYVFGLIVLEVSIAYVSCNPFFVLNENQWLYISSMLAQVIAALFGLTFAGYQFYQENMQKMIESDESLFDSVQVLRMNFYNKLRVLCYTVSFDVSCFIIAMILWKQHNKVFYFVGNFTFNNGVIFFAVSTILIVLFILKVADPDYLATISNQAKKKLDDERAKEEHRENNLNEINEKNYFEFMRDFKQMETYIINITKEIEQQHKLHIYKRMTLVDRIEMIGMYHGEMAGLLSRVNRIRQYRNYLVHGRGDNYVSQEMLYELQTVFYQLQEKLEEYKKYGKL